MQNCLIFSANLCPNKSRLRQIFNLQFVAVAHPWENTRTCQLRSVCQPTN